MCMTETLIIKSDLDRFDDWENAFQNFDIRILDWNDPHSKEEVDYALVWKPEKKALHQFPNLKIIFSVGAGLDHLKGENLVPENIPVVRMVEEGLTAGMVEYVTYMVLRFHRFMPEYEQQRQQQQWQPILQIPATRRTVGILGLGILGQACADQLLSLGFNVAGWSRTAKNLDNIQCFHGNDQLSDILAISEYLVCLLPMTEETEGILNQDLFEQLPYGAILINAGRGQCQIEADIVEALDSGQLGGAALDVFETEPLPQDSPLWNHPKFYYTPHVASMTLAETSAIHVYNNIQRFRKGEPLTHVADMTRGY